MGCCHVSASQQAATLVLPPQESLLAQAERPFHRISAKSLVEALAGPTAEVRRQCAQLGVAATVLETPGFARFLAAVQAEASGVSQESLLVAGVLLAGGSFQEKAECLLELYGFQQWRPTEVTQVLHDLVQCSLWVIPQLVTLNPMLEVYLTKLAGSESLQ